jgi:hypothetical protein
VPIRKAMDHAHFPWNPLGALLVDEGLLTAGQLEQALTEQRRTGRLLGQILVEAGYLTASSLARALTEQHGVELRRADGSERGSTAAPEPVGAKASVHRDSSAGTAEPGAWRPLGRLLVEDGFVTQSELDRALGEQRLRDGRRLGEILVERGYLTGPALARALAEQHGVALGAGAELDGHVETVIRPPALGEPVYQVFEVVYEPSYQAGAVLYESANFLEAADFASELVADKRPEALEIQRAHGGTRETVWTYSDSRAAAVAADRKALVETFGFDPTRWGGPPPAR